MINILLPFLLWFVSSQTFAGAKVLKNLHICKFLIVFCDFCSKICIYKKKVVPLHPHF